MTEPAAVLEAEAPLAEAVVATPFYVVGSRKFVLMFIFTFGLYTVYWMYRQWKQYRASRHGEEPGAHIWPVMRAIFGVFYFHSLFAKVRAHAAPRLDEWEYRTHATILVVLVLAERLIDKLSGTAFSDWDVLGLILMAPLCYFHVKAQQLINDSCGDPKGALNNRLTRANYGWIAAALVMMLCYAFAPVMTH